MFRNALSFKGRIGRREYILDVIFAFVWLIFLGFIFILVSSLLLLVTFGRTVFLVVNILSLAFFISAAFLLVSQGAKRCHDIGKSIWFIFIPLYGFVLLFIKGQQHPNKYGEIPKRF